MVMMKIKPKLKKAIAIALVPLSLLITAVGCHGTKTTQEEEDEVVRDDN